MAKRRRLDAPDPADLAEIESGFAAKPVPDRMGLNAPIAQVAAETARLSSALDTETRVAQARDATDAGQWRSARADGRVLARIPLDRIVTEHLPRDRMMAERPELDELKHSLRHNGQRLPIEVVELDGGRFGLISGWRRVSVLQELQAEGGVPHALALIRPATEAGASYTAMVEENELRTQLSPYERGRIAVIAADQGAFTSPDAAVEAIFAAASKAKRSKIRSFALVHQELGDLLAFPTDLTERNGLRLSQALRMGFATALRAALSSGQGVTAAGEWAVLERVVQESESAERPASSRGGRPRSRNDERAFGMCEALADGLTMEHVAHDDGFSLRLRGESADAETADRMMQALRRQFS